ncbi:hypothetical protein [Actinoplanes sp. NPDC049265]|uniref:hypothetical protein n=1 Tax=Actinoplanes sp. NPDC049265 TaxID=3363902 RepID=UPI00371D297B
MTEPAAIPAPRVPDDRAATPLFAPAVPEESVPWAQQRQGHEPVTGRSRRRLHDLPGWDPEPPGEIHVRRRSEP